MDVNGLTQLISTYGFPIVAWLIMAYYIKYTTDKHREEIHDINALHRSEMEDVTKAINNNTIALNKLIDYIGSRDGNNSD